jgi:hypothetical protein
MRYARHFHPEWGCLAPAPGFIRTARVVFVSSALGATIGAGVVFSLIAYPDTDSLVSTRTLVRPSEATSTRTGSTGLIDRQSAAQQQSPRSDVITNQLAALATSRSRDSSTRQALAEIAVSADSVAATDGVLAKVVATVPAAVVRTPASTASINMKPTKKLNVTSRYTTRGELFRLAPGEKYPKGSLDEYHETGALVGNRNVERGSAHQFSSGRATTSPDESPAAFVLGVGSIVTRFLGQSSP